MKLLRIKKSSLKKLAKYLGVVDIQSAYIQDFSKLKYFSNLIVKWKDKKNISIAVCTSNLHVLTKEFEYEQILNPFFDIWSLEDYRSRQNERIKNESKL